MLLPTMLSLNLVPTFFCLLLLPEGNPHPLHLLQFITRKSVLCSWVGLFIGGWMYSVWMWIKDVVTKLDQYSSGSG